MTISASELFLTAAVASRLEVRDHTDSTNADLVAVGTDATEWPHLSVILTDDQRSGRGRLDRSWQAPAGSSVALSVLLDAEHVAPERRGWMPLVAGLAMTQSIAAQLGSAVSAKWPNDVLVGDKKICGILAEVIPGTHRIVVGSGVNTTMTEEQAPVDTATSFAMANTSVHLDLLLSHYLGTLAREFETLLSGGDVEMDDLRARYSAVCSTIGKTVNVQLPGSTSLSGEAISVAEDGQLLVLADGNETKVSAGDVVHVR